MNAKLEGIGMTSARTRERLIQRLREEGIRDERVLAAMREVPRHVFLEEALAHRAYEDTALPIGFGQTISQPFIVARMTEALLGGGQCKKVLEIGTGCGYQTAVLARVVSEVFTVERLEPLMKAARRRLASLRAFNVRFHLGDGSQGWREHAPYDGILVAAAADSIPEPLLAQLAPGGRLVIPVGETGRQELKLIQHGPQGFVAERIELVNFVPLVCAAPRGS
jgi:protein-L-isoaspartate(D-aspartate) O-methyltransferase